MEKQIIYNLHDLLAGNVDIESLLYKVSFSPLNHWWIAENTKIELLNEFLSQKDSALTLYKRFLSIDLINQPNFIYFNISLAVMTCVVFLHTLDKILDAIIDERKEFFDYDIIDSINTEGISINPECFISSNCHNKISFITLGESTYSTDYSDTVEEVNKFFSREKFKRKQINENKYPSVSIDTNFMDLKEALNVINKKILFTNHCCHLLFPDLVKNNLFEEVTKQTQLLKCLYEVLEFNYKIISKLMDINKSLLPAVPTFLFDIESIIHYAETKLISPKVRVNYYKILLLHYREYREKTSKIMPKFITELFTEFNELKNNQLLSSISLDIENIWESILHLSLFGNYIHNDFEELINVKLGISEMLLENQEELKTVKPIPIKKFTQEEFGYLVDIARKNGEFTGVTLEELISHFSFGDKPIKLGAFKTGKSNYKELDDCEMPDEIVAIKKALVKIGKRSDNKEKKNTKNKRPSR